MQSQTQDVKLFVVIMAVGSVAALGGCSTLEVSRGSHDDPKSRAVAGVPFYVKRRVYDQVTTIRTTWYRIRILREEWPTLSSEHPPVVTLVDERFADVATSGSAKLGQVVAALSTFGLRNNMTDAAINADQAKIVGQMDAAVPRTDLDTIQTNARPTLVSNVIRPTFEVDDTTVYYINGVHPLSGKGEAKFELSSELTLNKVESSLESKPQDLITAVLPVKEYLTAKYVTPLNAPPPAAASPSAKTILTRKLDLGLMAAGLDDGKDARVVRFRIELVPESETKILTCRLPDRGAFVKAGLHPTGAGNPCEVQTIVLPPGEKPQGSEEPKKEEPGWKLDGKLTPPKAPA